MWCRVVIVSLALAAGCTVPLLSKGGDKKAECDRISAQAIQTKSAGDARSLAAQATECYARLAE
jgi:hypothetical protein